MAILEETKNNISFLHDNSFFILELTTRDNKSNIINAAEERSLEIDHELCQRARAELTNPRLRLSAEMNWLPGISPRKAKELISSIAKGPEVFIDIGETLPALAYLNLLSASFETINDTHSIKVFSRLVLKMAEYFDEHLDASEIMRDINEDRDISGFPQINNIEQIEELSKEPITEYSDLFSNDVLITVARLSKQKGINYLLDIYKRLNTSAKLLILGDGELKEELVTLSKELGLKTFSVFNNDEFDEDKYDVYFIGYHQNPFQYIANSKLFIMSSLWEGFGNTIVESMACGTPVVSTDCESGPKEIIAPCVSEKIIQFTYSEYGVLGPELHLDKTEEVINIWVDGLEKLLDDKEELHKYIEVGKKRAKDFDISNIMKEWTGLVESV